MGKIKIPDVVTVDFETLGIERRPNYPPKPVGVSVQYPGERAPTYFAWAHPAENNCSIQEGMKQVRRAWESGLPLLFQNGKFDIDVAETHCGVKRLDWRMYHDTLFLIFLHDPHARTFSLKPTAERLLKMPPEEQDAVRDWVMSHKREIEHKYGRTFTPKEWGAYICEAPGALVGKYAKGDVIRTLKLFKHLYPKIVEAEMLAAYDRERRIMPIFMDNERIGMRVDVRGLERDVKQYRGCLEYADQWLRRKLRAPSLNVDSDAEMANALRAAGVVTDFVKTPTGRDSVSKNNLTVDLFKDAQVFRVFGYRNRLTTCLKMFMEPWLNGAGETGYISTNWNQVRQTGGAGNNGTRTGRPSTSNPNFLNLSKSFYDKNDGYEHPKGLKTLIELPLVRRYILPDKGHIFLHRDYSQQELRLLAYFENDKLLAAYRENPRMDVHEYVSQSIFQITGQHLERRFVKILNFGMLYGMGIGKLAASMGIDVNAARTIKNAQLHALPGLKQLNRDIQQLADADEPIHTFGGRQYYQEPPIIINGKKISFVYKLLNYLIQGSAADVTKDALIRYHEQKKDGRFLVTVYDEINASAPRDVAKKEMKILKNSMEKFDIDVPMLSDGKWGPNWADVKKFND